ncbi:MAG: DUF937 domain-containing protein [Hyphomicrobiaceae bacterium]|nr:DUF937 domain-containing protein [Hyphomicrobiaceae bacterium]
MNIVSIILQYLGPSLVNKFATALGMESGATNKAVAAAVPAILSGIIGRAAAPGGAKNLQDIIARQEPGILDRLSESIGTSRQNAMSDVGRTALGSLIGVDQIGSLAGALSKFTGGSLSSANTLLGLITPGILGVLGREQKSHGFDAAGLANMLQGQKHNVASALPPEFRTHLAGSNLLDALAGKTVDETEKLSSGHKPSTGTLYTPPSATSTNGTSRNFSWPGWLVAIAATAAMWASVFGNRLAQMVDPNPPATVKSSAAQPRSFTVGTADVARDAMDSLDALKATLLTVKNEQSARASVPKLQEAASRIEKIETLATQLRPDAKRRLGEMVAGRGDEMRTVLDAAQPFSANQPLVRNALDELRTRIGKLSKL